MPWKLGFATLFFVSVACAREVAQTPVATAAAVSATAATMTHYEIRADQLPPPFATESSGNPPIVTAQPAGATLQMPPGFSIAEWATGLSDPRTMLLAPNGDVFLAEPGAGRVQLLRDTNHDGIADARFTFVGNLNEPFGLALHAGYLYVGNTDSVVRVPYVDGQTTTSVQPQRIASLPGGGHSTRGLQFNQDETKLYVSIGSSDNVEPDANPVRAAIVEMNPNGTNQRVFASGLRNPVMMSRNPVNGALWTVVNERDGLGDDLVPDYATEVRDGAFYGWPYAYIGPHEEPRRKGERPDLVAKSIEPSVLIQAHSAPLGITFYDGTMFPAAYRGDAFVALHGSWNRSKRTGYKVIRIPFENGQPTGGYDDFVVGWSTDENSRNVWGRPVGLLVLPDGSLLISDDGSGRIFRVTYSGPATAGPRRRVVTH
jgi:glucose/arabinose dehydrogenase